MSVPQPDHTEEADLDTYNVLEESRALLREAYEVDERPWVVAYSGGKDSTLVH